MSLTCTEYAFAWCRAEYFIYDTHNFGPTATLMRLRKLTSLAQSHPAEQRLKSQSGHL